MAESDKIKQDDLYEKDLLKPLIDDGKALITVFDELKVSFTKVAAEQAKIAKNSSKDLTAENLDKTTKALNQASEARQRAEKIDKEKIKLEQRLKILNSSAIDQNTELKVLIQEQNKINKEFAKDKLGLIDAYTKESKRLNELRKRYKNLVLEEGKATKQSGKLLKEIRDLDKKLKDIDASVGQFQRSVGDYDKQALGASKASLAWTAAIIGLNSEMGNVNNVLNANEEAGEGVRETTGAVEAVVNDLQNRAVKAGKGILDLIKIYTGWDSQNVTLSGSINQVGGATEDLVDDLTQIGKTTSDAIANQIAWEKELRILNEDLAVINGRLEEQNLIAGDTTKTFDEQEEAVVKAQKLQLQRADLLESIAQREIDLINQNIASRSKLTLEEVKALSTAELAEKTDKNINFLLNQRSEATIKLTEAQNELTAAELENERSLREIKRDRFERELDFAIDAFDAQKTINERRIADERKTIEEREDILNETIRLADSSFQSQKDLFAEFVDDRVDFDALVAETDEAAIRRTLLKLGLDNTELGRALEVIKERKLAVQDLEDAERDIFDAKLERFQRSKDALDELRIAEMEYELEQTNNIYEQFILREQILKEQAAIELENAELTADERLAIQEQLNIDLALLDKERVEDIKKFEEEKSRAIVDARLETAQSISQVSSIIAGEDEDRQRAVMAVDKAIATGEIIINLQREISDIRTNNAKNDTTQLNAPQITAATAAAFAGIATIASQSFFDGTENTGNGGRVDDRGGFHAILHPNERVMTARQNAKVGDLSNNELADIALMYNRGDLVNPFTDMALNITSNESKKDNTNQLIISELKSLKTELKNKPVSQFAFDRMGNMIETRFSNGVKDIIKHQAKKRV